MAGRYPDFVVTHRRRSQVEDSDGTRRWVWVEEQKGYCGPSTLEEATHLAATMWGADFVRVEYAPGFGR